MRINHTMIQKGMLVGLSVIALLTFAELVHQIDIRTWKFQSPVIWQSPVLVSKKVSTIEVVNVVEAEAPIIDPCANLGQIDTMICQTFGKDWKTARAIAMAESHENPNAIHKNSDGSYDIGIFQENSVHFNRWTLAQMSDPKTNIQIAYQIFKEQGFNPWSTFKDQSYKKYLK